MKSVPKLNPLTSSSGKMARSCNSSVRPLKSFVALCKIPERGSKLEKYPA